MRRGRRPKFLASWCRGNSAREANQALQRIAAQWTFSCASTPAEWSRAAWTRDAAVGDPEVSADGGGRIYTVGKKGRRPPGNRKEIRTPMTTPDWLARHNG